jgi:murein L,D-transpeptidase YcbB/YkuD
MPGIRANRHALAVACHFMTLALLLAGTAAAQPLRWFEGTQPSAAARQAVAMLRNAESHGLAPRDYDAALLTQALDAARTDAAARAHFDRHLSAAMLRYLNDLNHGRRAASRPAGYAAPTAFDANAVLDAALASGRLADAEAGTVPRLSQYAALREALAHYRALDAHPAWQQSLPPLAAQRGRPPALQPGDSYAGLAMLRQRLVALGDLAADVPVDEARYGGELTQAVARFQARHGLTADGILGRATRAQLEIPPSRRAQQIALSMERLRWTPLAQAPRMVVINLPEFVLRAYEVIEGRIVVRETMKVIVGQSLDTRTPVFAEPMRAIEFAPYWNVPPSILRKELAPRLQRDPGHFDREGFEFIDGAGRVLTALTPERLAAAKAGDLRIRQRPGPRNALGDIKFVFPNRDSIYLHHTPQTALFARDRRDFSHGCIRIEAPVTLALFVLQGEPGWDEARIRDAMTAGRSTTLRLRQPVPVLIAYATALVRGSRPHFFDDIYGHDRRLAAELARPRPPLMP